MFIRIIVTCLIRRSRATDSRVCPSLPNIEVAFTHEGITGFAQKRFPNGSFIFTNPINCSPQDNVSRSCSLQDANTGGFYESSSWEYSWSVGLIDS